MFCRITTSLLAMAMGTCGQVGSNVVGQWKMNQRGNVSAPGARRASFWTRAPPVTFSGVR